MLKRTITTASYYVTCFVLLYFINKAYPSVPYTPGPVVLVFAAMIPVNILLSGRNIYVTKKVGNGNLLAKAIHAVACVLMIYPFLFT
ncbi:MAG: hypothetical protein ABJB86_12565 [Bacteroidota bacterium]